MVKIIFKFIIIVLIVVLHLSVLSSVDISLTKYFSLPIIFISFVAFLEPMSSAILSACLLGLLLDLYSPVFFGFYIIVFLLSAFAIQFFMTNFFQHKNLGSLLATSVLPLLIYQLIYLVYYYFSSYSGSNLSPQYLLIFFWQVLIHSLFVSFVYLLPNPISRKIKSPTIA